MPNFKRIYLFAGWCIRCYCLYLLFLGVLDVTGKNKWHIWNPEKFWVRIICFYAKFLFQNLTLLTWPWPDLDLTSIISQIGWCYMVKWPSLSISTYKTTQKICVAWHACGLFLVTIRDMILTLMFVLIQYLPEAYQHYWWVWALNCPSNWPYGPKCKNGVFWPWTWHVTLI